MVSAHPVRTAYVTAGVVLVGLGVLAIFTIGLPVLVAGLILLIDGFTNARRRWPRVFWPIVVGIAVLFVGYVLVAPLSCTSEAVARESGHAVGATSCTNLVAIDYSGGPGYNPPLWPALLAGATGGAIAGAVTRLLSVRLLERRLQEPLLALVSGLAALSVGGVFLAGVLLVPLLLAAAARTKALKDALHALLTSVLTVEVGRVLPHVAVGERSPAIRAAPAIGLMT